MDYDYGNQDFWVQGLVNAWDVQWKCDSIVGSYIWEWQDQGMADKFMEDRRGVDPTTGLRDNNYKGVVTATRGLKPAYYNVKMVYSPVTIETNQITPVNGQFVVLVENRYSFTDLSELTCRWQALAGEKELAKGEARVTAKPRSSTEASFPATAGMDTLRIEFFHPDGRSIYSTRLHTKEYKLPEAPAALAAKGPVKLTETDATVFIETAGTVLTLDKKTGLIQSWKAGNETVVIGGPILNLGEQLVRGAGGPGGGGGRGRGSTFVQSPQPPELRNPAITARMNGDIAHVAVTSDVYVSNSPDLKGQLTYTFDVGPDAQADFTWNLAWKAADATGYEAGIKFLLPATTDRLTWSNQNRWTEYPAGHIGSTFGTVTSKDISFRSSKRDLRWMALSGSGNCSLVALSTGDSKQPTHARGLATPDGTLLFLSSQIAIPNDYGIGIFQNSDVRLTQASPLSSAFRLRISTKQ
jgi:beta-galactosidase